MELSPDNPDISFLVGKMYELTNRQNEAIEVLQRSLKQSPEHVLTLYQLSEYFYRQYQKDLKENYYRLTQNLRNSLCYSNSTLQGKVS